MLIGNSRSVTSQKMTKRKLLLLFSAYYRKTTTTDLTDHWQLLFCSFAA